MSKIYPYAGFWKRLGAFVVDSIVLAVPTTILYVLLMWHYVKSIIAMNPGATSEMTPEMLSTVMGMYGSMFGFQILSVVIFWLYYAWMESSKHQATLGKMAFGLKVVDEQGQRLSFWHATGRTLGKFISSLTLYIGFLMAGATRRKQALHDIMASAYVVDKHYNAGEELPEVPTHFVILGISITALVLAFLIPFVLMFVFIAMGFNEGMENAKNKVEFSKQVSQDYNAMAKLMTLQDSIGTRQTLNENGYVFTVGPTDVRAQRNGDDSFALVMSKNAFTPCCQPLVPDATCPKLPGVSVCTAK